MKNIKLLLCLFMAATFLTSCTARLSPFTKTLYEDNAWSEDDLKRIQFYLSKEIIIYRQLKNSDTRITSGKILSKDGRQVEEIIIKKRTPGVFEFQRDSTDHFAISFDTGGQYLMFAPNPKMNNKYTLRAKEWKRGGKGIVTYGEEEFTAIPGSGYATLLVDLKKAQNTSIKSRRAKGRRVN